MHILRLLRLGGALPSRNLLIITVLAGIANVSLIALINSAAEQSALDEPIETRLLLLYLIAFSIFLIANRASLYEANTFMQKQLDALRLGIADKILRADLRTLEKIGHGDIFSTLAQETNHLSQTISLLANAFQSLVLFFLFLFYIFFISKIAFVVVAASTAIGLYFFWRRRQAMDVAMLEVHAHESLFLDSLQHYTDGFQELRLNADKNDAYHKRFKQVLDKLEEVIVGIGGKWALLLLFSNAFLYALVGVVVFVLPLFFQGYTDTVYKIVAASIFLVGPVTAVTSAAPLFSKADVGLKHVFDLEQRLDQGDFQAPAPTEGSNPFHGFRTITLENIRFSYRDDNGNVIFATGPWTMDIHRGERLFLLGGNGSGKSTALKLICGLYEHEEGRILVDGIPVVDADRHNYRGLFSCIFTDFHLFDRLYGLEGVDSDQVNQLIQLMELEDKVSFSDGRFSTLELSTGQRKRLAMIVSLLEDRSIYLFDEWASDQDTHFRTVFYTEILPRLKEQGKTVLAVTHDDRFWHLSDRTLTLEIGTLRPGPPPHSRTDEM